MFKVANHVGRLVEVRLASPLDLADVQRFVQEMVAVMEKVKGKYVGVVDMLDAHVFPAAVADKLSLMLSGAATRVERTAMLIGNSAVFGMQVERVIRDANNPNRRVFRVTREMVSWLSEILTPAERARVERLAEEIEARRTPAQA
ncbi:MAG TPA: hypothetical protein VGR02_15900 [Thermoanaerobaculia bacterium]|jgi:hypothetical protein|nr:hypothetical protein [Thermoanaerobaculia bacterium]